MTQSLKETNQRQRPSWQSGLFAEQESDPLAGFANIMDVMLVFAMGLMLALISHSKSLKQHFQLEEHALVTTGKELVDPPDAVKARIQGDGKGMQSLGQVYRDPKTGKLILVGGQ